MWGPVASAHNKNSKHVSSLTAFPPSLSTRITWAPGIEVFFLQRSFSYTSISQTKCACGTPRDPVGLGSSLGFCIASRFPRDADGTSLAATLWFAKSYDHSTVPHPCNPYNFLYSFFKNVMIQDPTKGDILHWVCLSSLSFHLQHSPWIFFFLWRHWHFWRVQAGCLVEYASIWVFSWVDAG